MIKNLLSSLFLRNAIDKTNIKEDLETVLDNKSKNTDGISKQERIMLMNILKIDEILARDIMIPRAEIIAVEGGMCKISFLILSMKLFFVSFTVWYFTKSFI